MCFILNSAKFVLQKRRKHKPPSLLKAAHHHLNKHNTHSADVYVSIKYPIKLSLRLFGGNVVVDDDDDDDDVGDDQAIIL